MPSRIEYPICPACGLENPEKKRACARCDNRLFSDSEEEHRRYVSLIEAEHRKRSLMWYGGWMVVALVFLGPLALILVEKKPTILPGAAVIVGAMVLGWRLIDLKPKRAGSAAFLRRHKKE